MLPNFLIVGAPKAGTTSLWYYLSEHPQIFMSAIKEPYYFSDNPRKMTPNGYEKLFENVKNEIAIGEASAYYLWHDEAYQNIKKIIPDCKIIIMLRDPANRLTSGWYFGKRFGKNPGSIESLINKWEKKVNNVDSTDYPFYNGRRSYYQGVKKYIDLFGKENVFVGLFDDLCNSPLELIQSIYSFLGVNELFEPNFKNIYNIGGSPKSSSLPRITRILGSVFKPVLIKFINYEKLIAFRNKILFINLNRGKKVKSLSAKTRKRIQKIYYEDIIKLQKLLNLELSHWLK